MVLSRPSSTSWNVVTQMSQTICRQGLMRIQSIVRVSQTPHRRFALLNAGVLASGSSFCFVSLDALPFLSAFSFLGAFFLLSFSGASFRFRVLLLLLLPHISQLFVKKTQRKKVCDSN